MKQNNIFDINPYHDPKSGRFTEGGNSDYSMLKNKNIEHYTSSGSGNKDRYKGLNEKQVEIVKSFESFNENRQINEISGKINTGEDKESIIKEYGEQKFKQYEHMNNYLKVATPYDGEITRLIRDDKGIEYDYKIGDTMEFTRFTSFGEKGNEFQIRGGDLRLHIEKNTRGKSIKNLMPFKEEKEVLIDKGKYKVIKKILGHIYLEEV